MAGLFYETLPMKKILAFFALSILLAACADSGKKIVVMSKGSAEINTDTKTITSKDGAGHEEKEAFVSGDKIIFALSTPSGNATVELLENGLYIINAKNDTIIGSYQKYSDPKQAQATISQESLKQKIDSLQSLSEGRNVSSVNRNFFILPNHAAKITGNLDAIIVGPYHQMRSAEKKDGKDPEVYRFYSIKEIREMLGKMRALTVGEKI
ncbi:MAG: hypothetical protein JWQ78_1135 [Sediminibacterium sp.]|nr:hypothetical protein [Sediminibacterium sp.]